VVETRFDLRQHIIGTGNADVRQFTPQPLDRGDFMDGIEIGMQEANRDRSDAGSPDSRDGFAERSIVERRGDLAVGLQPFKHTKPALARHQRLRRRNTQIVTIALEAFTHFDHVAMALRRQQRNFGAFLLEQRIGRDRRAVDDAVGILEHIRARHLQPPGKLVEPRHHPD
jgi:hypothetical protein